MGLASNFKGVFTDLQPFISLSASAPTQQTDFRIHTSKPSFTELSTVEEADLLATDSEDEMCTPISSQILLADTGTVELSD